MTEESICMRCAELIRIRVNDIDNRICPVEGIRKDLRLDDTVEECSRYVEVPGDEVRKE